MFCYNKYFYIYTSIITNSKSKSRSKSNGYYERHHINPKCMGGGDTSTNLVLLTAREHYICHHLLTKFTNNDKIHYAFWAMCNQSSSTQCRDYIITSRIYENAKLKFSQIQSNRLRGVKPKYTMTDEHRVQLKNRMKANNPSHLSHVRESSSKRMTERMKINNPMNNKKSRDKVSKSKIGSKNPMFIGYYVTPWGIHESSTSASHAAPIKINATTIASYCKKSGERITKIVAMRSPIFSLDDIGKTYADMGFKLSAT